MRIVLDARTIRPGMSGVGHYTAQLASALPGVCPDDRFLFLSLRKHAVSMLPEVRGPNVEWIEIETDYESHPAGDWWMHQTLPRLLDEWGAEVFHGPAFLSPFRPLALPGLFRAPCAARVVSLHDLSTFSMPEAYPRKFGAYLRWGIARSVASADRVIVPTGFVREEALARWPNLPPEKIEVTPLGIAPLFSATPPGDPATLRARYGLPEHFLLMVGVFERRKNPEFILSLYEALFARLGAQAPPFVWAGWTGFGGRNALAKLEPLRRKGLFRLIEPADQRYLPALYHTASVFVCPSWNEGFGLPVLEAMACGLPVISSDRTSLPEVVGDGGRILPLDAPAAWAEAIAETLENPDRRAAARARALARAAAFSWEKTARQTAEIYRRAVRSDRSA